MAFSAPSGSGTKTLIRVPNLPLVDVLQPDFYVFPAEILAEIHGPLDHCPPPTVHCPPFTTRQGSLEEEYERNFAGILNPDSSNVCRGPSGGLQ